MKKGKEKRQKLTKNSYASLQIKGYVMHLLTQAKMYQQRGQIYSYPECNEHLAQDVCYTIREIYQKTKTSIGESCHSQFVANSF